MGLEVISKAITGWSVWRVGLVQLFPQNPVVFQLHSRHSSQADGWSRGRRRSRESRKVAPRQPFAANARSIESFTGGCGRRRYLEVQLKTRNPSTRAFPQSIGGSRFRPRPLLQVGQAVRIRLRRIQIRRSNSGRLQLRRLIHVFLGQRREQQPSLRELSRV